VRTTGNVGIGTTAPRGRLDIAPSTGEGDIWGVDRIIGYNDLRLWGDNTGTDNTKVLYLSSSGNVGIGTTAPGAKLEVAGNIHTNTGNIRAFGPNSQGVLLEPGTNDASYSDLVFYNGGYRPGRIDASTLILQTRSGGNVGIGTTAPAQKLHVEGAGNTAFRVSSDTYSTKFDIEAQDTKARLRFFNVANDRDLFIDSDAAGTTRLFIQGSTGNVGIGTTNPGAKLHVKGAAYFEGTDPTAPGIFAKLVEYGGGGRLYLGKSNLYGGDEVFMEGFGNIMFFASNRPGALLVWINDGSLTVDRSLTVKSNVYLASVSGNVGIGTGSPSYKLEINGTLGYTGGTGPFCIFANACPNGWVDKGLGGYIYNSGGGATCPYSVGAAFNASWTWCHPRICCQW